MQINSSSPIWQKLISGQVTVPLKYLAGKIALSHLQLQVKIGRYTVEKAAYEMYMIYLKGETNPHAKNDIETLSKQK
ncbi:MAG: hypothetical protein II956_02275 [Bacteroidales bacterium]|nr:hypothetical protein [Bacteroidales bacterium]